MSARLNMNERPMVSWKGKTFQQITSSIKKNVQSSKYVNMANNIIFKATPLKIYRREIASIRDASNCNVRTSVRIDEINRPNGSIITTVTGKGLVNTLDIGLTSNTTERPGLCNTSCIFSSAENARRRLRSSGNVKKQFNPATNNSNYYTDNKQYLVSRTKTFQQNQYNYIKLGDATLKPGDSLSVSNVYVGNGNANCKKYHIEIDTSFSYVWLDGTVNKVDLSAGYYDASDLNTILHSNNLYKGHYYIRPDSKANVFLLNIVYNSTYNNVELQSIKSGASDSSLYSIPLFDGSYNQITWTYPTTNKVPQFVIYNNVFKSAVGFTDGTYPTSSSSAVTVTSLSTFAPGITPFYQPLYYKPNNYQFAQQGAVSASALTARVRYNSITNATAVYRNAYGPAVANALAYGVPENGYTIKDKIGYPNICYPVFPKTGGMIKMTEKCSDNKL